MAALGLLSIAGEMIRVNSDVIVKPVIDEEALQKAISAMPMKNYVCMSSSRTV